MSRHIDDEFIRMREADERFIEVLWLAEKMVWVFAVALLAGTMVAMTVNAILPESVPAGFPSEEVFDA